MTPYYLQGFTARCQELGLTEKQAQDLWKMGAEQAQAQSAQGTAAPAKPENPTSLKQDSKTEVKQPLPSEQQHIRQLIDGSIELKTIKKLVPGSPEYEQFMQAQGSGTAAAPAMPGAPAAPAAPVAPGMPPPAPGAM